MEAEQESAKPTGAARKAAHTESAMKLYSAGIVAVLGGILFLATPAQAIPAKAAAKKKAQQQQQQSEARSNKPSAGNPNVKGQKNLPNGKARQENGLAKGVKHHNRPEYAAQNRATSANIMAGQTRQQAKRNARQQVKAAP